MDLHPNSDEDLLARLQGDEWIFIRIRMKIRWHGCMG
jgi:hypothetical protein